MEETKQLNEQLQRLQQEAQQIAAAVKTTSSDSTAALTQPPSTVTLTGGTSDTIQLHVPDLLYIEAVGNYVKIYQLNDGQVRSDMLRATSKQMEEDLSAYPTVVRCHRAFLVNLQQVEQIVSRAGAMQLIIKHCHEALPVSRSNAVQVKEAIKQL